MPLVALMMALTMARLPEIGMLAAAAAAVEIRKPCERRLRTLRA
jgi:hypothetical protein